MSKQILPENRTRTSGNSVSGIVRKLLALFTAFSEADARVLLSGYGLHEFEVDQMRWDRPDWQKKSAQILVSSALATASIARPDSLPLVCIQI
jgi:hypothetical protein